MANKIIEGLWDCPYCGQKGIGGLTKSCPNCAHPQDAGTKFYLGDKKQVLDAEKAQNYGKGADWTCSFCGSLNHYDQANCQNCGAERVDSSGDYFENRRKEAAQQAPPMPVPRPKKPKGRILLAVALAIIALIVFIASPRKSAGKVLDKYWERSIAVEVYKTVQETDWSLPSGAELISSYQAIRYYDQVLDHYETEYYDVGEEVLDGYDTYTDYIDNGDGTFSESEYSVPRYRTEYHTESREVPVYRDEPVYGTQYDYYIDKWVPDRTEEARGSCAAPSRELSSSGDWPVAEPYWPETRMSGNEREQGRSEVYYLLVESAKGNTRAVNVDRSLWDQYAPGDRIEIKVNGLGEITSIAGVNVH